MPAKTIEPDAPAHCLNLRLSCAGKPHPRSVEVARAFFTVDASDFTCPCISITHIAFQLFIVDPFSFCSLVRHLFTKDHIRPSKIREGVRPPLAAHLKTRDCSRAPMTATG